MLEPDYYLQYNEFVPLPHCVGNKGFFGWRMYCAGVCSRE